ncbi:MAG: NADH-quinone oxidoreductase subunit, partial [Actinomycetota bacterium]|nr:NADH-quinone oxidoreductase subunit [Actinomycetota bacterium]
EELAFLGARVAGRFLDVTYADLEAAPFVLLVGFEPEEESPIVFLRLRKAAFKKGTRVVAIAPLATHGLNKMQGRLLATLPGGEAAALHALVAGKRPHAPAGVDADAHAAVFADTGSMLSQAGAVVLVGERLAGVPGGFSAVAELADATGARVAWIPRRAGERGALEAGAAPSLLPGGRPIADSDARGQVALRWATSIPAKAGRDTTAILRAAAAGSLGALVVGGVDPDDLPDPQLARAALEAAPFVVSLELRPTAVTAYADVVFPVAAAAEKGGTYLDWEGRSRPFDASLKDTGQLLDLEVLHAIADALDVHLGLPDLATARFELDALAGYVGSASSPPAKRTAASALAKPGPNEALLATWHELLDAGSLQDRTPYLAATAKPVRAHLSPATASALNLVEGDLVTVRTDHGAITVPVFIAVMTDSVVWVPTRSTGSEVYRTLGVGEGAVVRLEGSAR